MRAIDRCPALKNRDGGVRDSGQAVFFLSNGVPVTIRPVTASDHKLFAAFEAQVSAVSRYQRFFSLRAFTVAEIDHFTSFDTRHEGALIAVVQDQDEEREVGVARYARDVETGRHDVALLVADPWQGLGLGKILLTQLIAHAATAGVQTLEGTVLSTNVRMLALVRQLRFSLKRDPMDATVTKIRRTVDSVLEVSEPSRWPSLV